MKLTSARLDERGGGLAGLYHVATSLFSKYDLLLRIVVTGGTGSLGKALLHTLLRGAYGRPAQVVVFSRDEAKQHDLRLSYRKMRAATEEVICEDFEQVLQFQIGDVRDFNSVARAVKRADAHVLNDRARWSCPPPSECSTPHARHATS